MHRPAQKQHEAYWDGVIVRIARKKRARPDCREASSSNDCMPEISERTCIRRKCALVRHPSQSSARWRVKVSRWESCCV
eukprot:scaffold102045_cov63-Phaeocystis_antarctica.AAC.1